MPYSDPARKLAHNREWKRHNPATVKANKSRELAKRRELRHERRKSFSFVGVDGEGYTEHVCADPSDCPGTECRHYYMMLVDGDDVLYTGEPLRTVQILDWLCSRPKLPKDVWRVGFFFDYDVTMILRDLLDDDRGRDALQRIFSAPENNWQPTMWRGFLIDYLPRKRFRVWRKRQPVFAVHDVQAFYQCSFVKAISDAEVGTFDERTAVNEMKAKRADFRTDQAAEIADYCKLECRLLADLVSDLQSKFSAVNWSASPFEGPGPVAQRVLAHQLGAASHRRWVDSLPPEVADYAKRAYYGGRFEIAAHGTLNCPVWQYDLKSAYPAAMQSLPCLEHGEWERGTHGELFVAHVRFVRKRKRGYMMPLPVRLPNGNIAFMGGVEGWYWSVEIPPDAELLDGWSYVKRCDCQPFRWVHDLYVKRQQLEAHKKGSGIALKLVLNSLYGKLAQRVGSAPFYNPVWASLITAITRSTIYQVHTDHPGKVAMFATDAVFVTEECPELRVGTGLGEWELEAVYNDLCIFKPGVYFSAGEAKFKTRGIPKREFSARAEEFRQCADRLDEGLALRSVPYLVLRRTNHLSLRSALQRGEGWWHRAGDWIDAPSRQSPHPGTKRNVAAYLREINGAMWSMPYRHEDPLRVTVPYNKNELPDELEREIEAELLLSEAAYDSEYSVPGDLS